MGEAYLDHYRSDETAEDLYEDGRPRPEAKIAKDIIERMDIRGGREEDGDEGR